jgi:predicted membrane protein
VALAVTTTTENLDLRGTGTQRWKPTSVAQIEPSYGVDLGDGNLDLRDVDFAGKDVTIRLAVNAGTMEVFLPQDLDLTADVRLAYGNVVVLGQDLSGASIQREISDLGADEATGPGQVDLQITVNAGNLEVKR